MEQTLCAGAARVALSLHAGYLLFALLGPVVVVEGAVLGWRWIRRPAWRFAHLAALVAVCALQYVGAGCPLTTAENRLRACAGEPAYRQGFVSDWSDRLFSRPVTAAAVARAEFLLAALALLLLRAVPVEKAV